MDNVQAYSDPIMQEGYRKAIAVECAMRTLEEWAGDILGDWECVMGLPKDHPCREMTEAVHHMVSVFSVPQSLVMQQFDTMMRPQERGNYEISQP